MARKKVSPDDKTPKQPFLTPDRKVEISGLLMMVIGLLVGISIVTHNPEDYSILSDIGLGALLKPDPMATSRISNGLGIAGAYLSHAFVHLAFGYFSAIVALVILQFGWFVFRHRSISEVQWPTVLLASGMVLSATIMGWFNIHLDLPYEDWSGVVGVSAAALMRTLTGVYGSMILLVAFALVLTLLLIDRDIQATIDRVRDWIDRFRDWIAERQEARAERRAAQKEVQKAEAMVRQTETALRKSEAKAKADAAGEVNTSKTGSSFENKIAVSLTTDQEAEPVRKPVTPSDPKPVVLSAEELARRSTDVEKRRYEEERAHIDDKIMPDRGILESDLSEAMDEESEDEDIGITVYVGEEEETAKDKDLERAQRAKEIPVIKYKFPTIDLLDSPPAVGNEVDFEEIKENKLIIMDKLKRHGIEIIGIEAIVGPTVTLYELQPAPDVKISKIESYANDLKMAMATHGLRIIAPIPGKSAVGIEVPNRKRETVFIKQLINTKKFVESKMNLPVAFGKTIENEVYMVDLTSMPHLLIAGATGSGKSVGINTIITCLLYKCHPENLKFVLIDPKKIELALYRHLQRHFIATLPDAEEPIITDTGKVMEVLTSVTKEMDDRYDLLKMALVRDIRSYNEKFAEGKLEAELGHKHLPYIVVIIDELADLMLTAGKAIEEPIARIAQLARAVGIHLVVATQRPSVNVITGTIKANFPVRIAYQVASKIDSRTILDTMGADQLVGRGDMLVSTGGRMVRVQNAFVSTEEVERINAFIGNQIGYNNTYYLPKVEDPNAHDSSVPDLEDRDDLFEEAAKVVVLHQQGSVSLIQRKLKLGYNRAGRIIDQLYAAGIVGPYQGSTAREVLIADEDELYEHLRTLDE
jgi:DNA segregation ATPase FtsK/SpoIIIE, S-DNA-T family